LKIIIFPFFVLGCLGDKSFTYLCLKVILGSNYGFDTGHIAGGATSTSPYYTKVLASKVSIASWVSLPVQVYEVEWEIYNVHSGSESITTYHRFFLDDNGGSAPGTLFYSLGWSSVSVPGNAIHTIHGTFGTYFNLTTSTFWVGQFYSTTVS